MIGRAGQYATVDELSTWPGKPRAGRPLVPPPQEGVPARAREVPKRFSLTDAADNW